MSVYNGYGMEGLFLARPYQGQGLWHMSPVKNQSEYHSCIWTDFNNFTDFHAIIGGRTTRAVPLASNSTVNESFRDMGYWLIAAVVLIFIRIFVERKFFEPLGKGAGVKDIDKNQVIPCTVPTAIPLLEGAYSSNPKQLPDNVLYKLIADTGLTVREIERWLRKRKRLDRPSALKKFSESGWRLTCYLISTAIGLWVVWDKQWVFNTELCFKNLKSHDLPMEIQLYYLYASGLYSSFLITQAFDIKRKDFWEMFVHHVITLMLLSFSWVYNLTRIGVYTLLLHDCSDIFLESAKMANYMKKQDLSTGIFVIFTIVWTATRLVIYPKNVVGTAIQVMIPRRDLPLRMTLLLISLLVILFSLHIFWTYFICKVAVSAITSGTENQKDSRSSSESGSDSSDEDVDKKPVEVSKEPRSSQGYNGMKRLSLQLENAAQIVSTINRKQRQVMKRISVEIM